MAVMITRNLCTVQSLTSATGKTVHAVGLEEAEVAGDALPSVIVIAVRAYTGPTAWRSDDGAPLVPITPVTTTWETSAGLKCSRTYSPLQLLTPSPFTIHRVSML